VILTGISILMKLATGIDLVDLARFEQTLQRQGARFLQRVFTPQELVQFGNHPESLAARFAAKEAVAKALGCGIGDVRWQDIEVLADEQHAPVLTLHATARQRAKSLGLQNWSISLSHSRQQAIALAIAIGEE
jgi:holo-[acyl-carrier protein] synthase